MPKITAESNAAQRENTKRAILNSFGELLYQKGLPGLTMTHVAKNAGIGRTAVYNYFADMGELLIAYALDETEKFLTELREGLAGINNPVEELAIYVRLQMEDMARRHMPPGPAMQSVLSPEAFAKLGAHVRELQQVLVGILQRAMDQRFIPKNDIQELALLIHGSLSSSVNRAGTETDEETRERTQQNTIRFIQMGVGARFNSEGEPVPLAASVPTKSFAL